MWWMLRNCCICLDYIVSAIICYIIINNNAVISVSYYVIMLNCDNTSAHQF